MNTKKCITCGEEKEMTPEFFPSEKRNKNGLNGRCHLCCREQQRKYRSKYRKDERYVARRRDIVRKSYYKHHEKRKEESRLAMSTPEAMARARVREARKRENVEYRLATNVSRNVRHALKGERKSERTFEALPYTPQQLREHIESQFEDWMTWDNYGLWHIDHIYPQSKLPYDSLEHPNFQKCWALENLRPLDAIENIMKSNKINEQVD
jgi:hypothetical protein|tara:strand:+ start:88 stop:714 length:627 start_codon:yes stop_codon:yes gene_type:complete